MCRNPRGRHRRGACEASSGGAGETRPRPPVAQVKLLLATFGVTPQKSDFRVQRGQTACHRVAVLRLDAAKCRAAYASNRLDYELYEHAHRAFCTRLAAAGLRDDPDVVAELAAAELCGTLDFTDAAAVCGRLETPAADAKREKLRAKCPNLLW